MGCLTARALDALMRAGAARVSVAFSQVALGCSFHLPRRARKSCRSADLTRESMERMLTCVVGALVLLARA
jgi:hypothetical protein